MKGPNNTKDHKGYFYAIQSSHLSDIKVAYQALQNDPPDDPTGKQWITTFAQYIKDIKRDGWHNSFKDLPNDNVEPPKNVLLLWKLDNGFAAKFYTTTKRSSGQSKNLPDSVAKPM